MTAESLTLFAHVCGRREAEPDLLEAALLVGEIEYERVDVAGARAAIDELGRGARRAVTGFTGGPRVERLLQYVYGELGFQGNAAEYYDPRNSFLSDVIARRTGIPISLAIVLVEIARRADVDAAGVGFPGHFLVRSPVPGGALVIDPFEGRLLAVTELRTLYAKTTGDTGAVPPRLLEPATTRQILLRMLNNLRGIYASRDDTPRLCRALERMQVLAPTDDTRAEIERLGGRTAVATTPRVLN
ncbi:MAG TPA: transglutaminase-like domain-containing protein [Minicystis sp.]|nr:transglutaminase-like domain-containing protein [Minicystis sp.]